MTAVDFNLKNKKHVLLTITKHRNVFHNYDQTSLERRIDTAYCYSTGVSRIMVYLSI